MGAVSLVMVGPSMGLDLRIQACDLFISWCASQLMTVGLTLRHRITPKLFDTIYKQ